MGMLRIERTSTTTAMLPESSGVQENAQRGDEVKSPVTDGTGSTGMRTPKTGRPPRNPWTIFMRMQVAATEPELREFFGEAKSGVCCVFSCLTLGYEGHDYSFDCRSHGLIGLFHTLAGQDWHMSSSEMRRL